MNDERWAIITDSKTSHKWLHDNQRQAEEVAEELVNQGARYAYVAKLVTSFKQKTVREDY